MRRTALCLMLLSAIAGSFLAGARFRARTGGGEARRVLFYRDPMHPGYRSAQPGIAPDCGMALEPVYAGSEAAEASDAEPPAGALSLSPEKQQLMGVQASPAVLAPGIRKLRLLGRVAPDETLVHKLIAGMDGTVRRISGVTTGSRVGRDEWLATFSAPELRAPLEGYLITLDVIGRQKDGGAVAPAQLKASYQSSQQALDRLLNLGISLRQLEDIRRTREVPIDLHIYAPAAGYVLSRNLSAGQRFDKGTEWFRIADLSRVWILADVFEEDSRFVRTGQSATIALPDGTSSAARVSEILPQADPLSRTLKVRLVADNSACLLRPDMFADVNLSIVLAPAVQVPEEAVLDSGIGKTVFVEAGAGVFEPREVRTGWHGGGNVQILSGVQAGERVVTSGNFLLDSESRLRQQTLRAQGPPNRKDPVCGMPLAAGAARLQAQYEGQTYSFCSPACKAKFDKDGGHFAHRLAGGERRANGGV